MKLFNKSPSNGRMYSCTMVTATKCFLRKSFPKCSTKTFVVGSVLLDPYGLHLDWQVIYTAGQMKSVEIFLNFPIMDMNMNVLKHNPETRSI